ncbi:MAG TPA: amidase family protein [Pseudomonadota bacterium]|nr:amidase family protein [Pseudomonadota bacterium]
MKLHELDATALLAALAKGETSSVEIVQSLIERRKSIGEKVSAIVLPLDDSARKAAEAADAARKRGDTLLPLHGLPVSIKDNFEVIGTPATLGVVRRRNHHSQQDAVAVAALKHAGAVVLGKTNVPQLLLVQESDNAIYGTTKNPWNRDRSPGGSSGGEGAAIATGQSPLGLGSDIGGSIRIPAHFCGVAGLKPTVDRWSSRGMLGGIDGQEVVRAAAGPMARSVRDLSLVMTALDPSWQARRDPAVLPLAVSDPSQVSLRGLRIGWFSDDGFMAPCPAIVRAVERAKAHLQAAGAHVVDFRPVAPTELLYLWMAVISSDAATTLQKQLEGEAVCKQLQPTLQAAKLPDALKPLVARLLAVKGDERLAKLLRSLGRKPVEELWRLTAQRTQMRRSELDAWNEANIDAVICPPHVLPAMPLGSSGDLTLTLSYMFRYVMLNFVAGVVPVTRVAENETTWQGPPPRDGVAKRCAEVVRGSAGLPIGVQVVSRPYREDVALAVMAAIEAAAVHDPSFPKTPIDPA